MNTEEAMQCGLGYAWGREDASGVLTVPAKDYPNVTATYAFAESYAQGWHEFNSDKRYMMVNVRDAYETWQASNGATIFKREFHPAECTEPFPSHDFPRVCGNCGYELPS